MQISQLKQAVDNAYEKFRHLKNGEPANYIPELAKVDPELFSIAIVNTNGEAHSVGNSERLFTLQSTSKPIVYGLALSQRGSAYVHSKVGVEPTGEAFNSIIELEEKSHRPFNPMINSGAISISSMIEGSTLAQKLESILKKVEDFVGHPVSIDERVFSSESQTAHRNRAIAYLMKHFSVMDGEVEEALTLYFKQCSILVNCNDLASIAATYANEGIQPATKKRVFDSASVVQTLSLMFTCGMYDTAGEWAFNVGLPAKSGVSGAIFTSLPGKFGLAVYSPRIDPHGHSIRGRLVIEDVAKALKANIFQAERES